MLEFKVRGCKILGADDIRDGFDKVHLGLLDGSPEGEAGGTFSCSGEAAAGKKRQINILIPSIVPLLIEYTCTWCNCVSGPSDSNYLQFYPMESYLSHEWC